MRRLIFSRAGWRILYLLVDGASAVAAWKAAIVLRLYVPMPWTSSLLPKENAVFSELLILPVLATQVAVILWFFGFYDHVAPVPRLRLSLRLISVSLIQGLILSGILFLLDFSFPRSVIPIFIAFNALFLLVCRLILQHFYRPWRRRVILVGSGPGAVELARNIDVFHWHGLDVVGHVTVPEERVTREDPALGPRLGSVEELSSFVEAMNVDDLILAASTENWKSRMVHQLAGSSPSMNLLLIPDAFESLVGRMRYRWVHDIPMIEVIARSENRLGHPLKRIFDLGVGTLLFLLALPLMGMTALLIRLSDPGPVLFHQVRVGQNRKTFTLVKFRTMRVNAEGNKEEVLAVEGDPRLISVGKVLRALRLDEWPQLWNVLKGEMSLVGPRPERPGFVEQYSKEVIGYGERFSARPGLTGLAQVNGDYHSSAENKLRYDLAYIANRSLWLDLSIIFRTVKTVLTTGGT